jgi:hypothetical protein
MSAGSIRTSFEFEFSSTIDTRVCRLSTWNKATLLYAQPKLPLHHHGWPEPLLNQVPGCTRRDYISWLQQTVSIKQSPAIARRRLAAALAVTQIWRHAARKKSDGRLDLGSRRTLPTGKKPGAGKSLWRRIKRREARVPRPRSCSHWRRSGGLRTSGRT